MSHAFNPASSETAQSASSPADSSPVLRAVGLTKQVKNPEAGLESALTILSDVTLDIPAGQTAAIIGASGAGKSTLLALLAGLDEPSAGQVWLNGVELTALQVFTNPDALPDLGYSQRPLLAGLGVTVDKVPPRVFTHLEQRSAAVTPQGFAVELAPGFAFSRVEVKNGVAVLTRSGGGQAQLPVECREQLDYAEPRELLRSYLAVTPRQ